MQATTPEYAAAVATRADRWVPANGGHETPTTYPSGATYLYVFNPYTGQHGYLDMSTDVVVTPTAYDTLFTASGE